MASIAARIQTVHTIAWRPLVNARAIAGTLGQAAFAFSLTVVLVGSSLLPALGQTNRAKSYPTVVLVHGAWADGSSWSKVIPLLEAKGLHVVAVQLPLTAIADDVATAERAIALQNGPVLLVGHSYGGVVITEAGNDPKVVGMVYVAAFAPDVGESVFGISALYPPAPVGAEIRHDAYGFLRLTPTGIWEDFAPDLSHLEKAILTATQGPTNVACFSTNVTVAAWNTKPTWFVVASEDRVISPELEEAEAEKMNATTITLHSSHVVMLSHPREVAELIEEAATGSK
jgi:pimeloyl-ACP methyl ester carboxylesterase